MKPETKRLAAVLNLIALGLFGATAGLLYFGAQDAAVIAFDFTFFFILCASVYWIAVYRREKKSKST